MDIDIFTDQKDAMERHSSLGVEDEIGDEVSQLLGGRLHGPEASSIDLKRNPSALREERRAGLQNWQVRSPTELEDLSGRQ